MSNQSELEKTVETKATVVPGLGFPADRIETSAEPTGWQADNESQEITQIDVKVSRETF